MKIYFLFIFLLMSNVYAFGVSPTNFNIELVNGETIEKEFFILNNNFETKLYNISNYNLEFFNFTSFIIEVDSNSEKEVKFQLNVPQEIVSNNFDGRIYVKEINTLEGGVNLDTLLGIKVNLDIKSDYILIEERLNFKQENNFVPRTKFEIIKTNKPETLFYVLIGVVILLCLIKAFNLNKLFSRFYK